MKGKLPECNIQKKYTENGDNIMPPFHSSLYTSDSLVIDLPFDAPKVWIDLADNVHSAVIAFFRKKKLTSL